MRSGVSVKFGEKESTTEVMYLYQYVCIYTALKRKFYNITIFTQIRVFEYTYKYFVYKFVITIPQYNFAHTTNVTYILS